MKQTKRKLYLKLGGSIAGLLNGLLGTGGGILAVLVFKKAGYEQKNAQACTLVFVLCMTVVSLLTLFFSGQKADWGLCVPLSIGGVPGALAGAYLLNKLNNKILQFLFAILTVASGLRMML